jgi:Icc protein
MSEQPFSTIPQRNAHLDEILKQRQSETLLRFVHISDTHISADPEYTHAEADYPAMAGAKELVRQINALPFQPDFVLHTGDVAFDPDPAAYEAARVILQEIQFPTYYLVGNHDNSELLQKTMLGRTEIVTPFDYEFAINGVQIVCVDSNGPAKFAGGSLSAAQLEWLESISKSFDTRPLVVAVHHNALPIGAPFWDDFMRMSNGEDFHRVLLPAQRRLRGVFFGHVHQGTETYRDGILYSSVLSSWYQLHCWPGQSGILEDREADPGFDVVTITRTQTFIRRHRFRVNSDAEATRKTTSSVSSV